MSPAAVLRLLRPRHEFSAAVLRAVEAQGVPVQVVPDAVCVPSLSLPRGVGDGLPAE